jgi:hypothetical protein
MWTRTTRWLVAAAIGLAMSAVGCGRTPLPPPAASPRVPLVADDSLVHAFDTSVEMRLLDRLQLDELLRERDVRIEVIDGVINITGEVWTAVEKQRVGELVRSAAGMIDVANELVVRAPE